MSKRPIFFVIVVASSALDVALYDFQAILRLRLPKVIRSISRSGGKIRASPSILPAMSDAAPLSHLRILDLSRVSPGLVQPAAGRPRR